MSIYIYWHLWLWPCWLTWLFCYTGFKIILIVIYNLHKFLTDINLIDLFNKFTKYKLKDLLDNINFFVIDHLTINYIYDSTNIISSDNATRLIKYLTCYYGLVKQFYDINKLTINSDKTDLIVSCKNKFRQASHTIKLINFSGTERKYKNFRFHYFKYIKSWQLPQLNNFKN